MQSKWRNVLDIQQLSLTVLVNQKMQQLQISQLQQTLVKSKQVHHLVQTVLRNTTNYFALKIN